MCLRRGTIGRFARHIFFIQIIIVWFLLTLRRFFYSSVPLCTRKKCVCLWWFFFLFGFLWLILVDCDSFIFVVRSHLRECAFCFNSEEWINICVVTVAIVLAKGVYRCVCFFFLPTLLLVDQKKYLSMRQEQKLYQLIISRITQVITVYYWKCYWIHSIQNEMALNHSKFESILKVQLNWNDG